MHVTLKLEGLRRLMKAQALTFRELSDLTGNQVSHLHNLAKGSVCATPKTALKLARALEADVTALTKPPSIEQAITDVLTELKLYRSFCIELYKETGVRLPKL